MEKMFWICNELENITFSSKFNTKNVTNMYAMFFMCEKLTTLDLTAFNTQKVTTIQGMFQGCKNLTTIYVSKTTWIIGSATNTVDSFTLCGTNQVTPR